MVIAKEVVRAIARSFPHSKRTAALKVLQAYRECQETERVQLAILILSNGNLDELRRMVNVASIDYRDVLAWAEYPEEYFRATKKQMAQRYRRLKLKVPRVLL